MAAVAPSLPKQAPKIDPRRALLPLINATADEVEAILHSVAKFLAEEEGITRVVTYLHGDDGNALQRFFDSNSEANAEAFPVRIEMAELQGCETRAFVPIPPTVIAGPVREPEGPSRQVAVFYRDEEAHTLALVVFVASAARRWELDEADAETLFLTELYARSGLRARAARRQETETHLMDTLMQHLPDAIYFKDARSRFIRASRQVVVQNGFLSFSELVGKTDFDLFTQEHAEQAFRDEEQVMRTGVPVIAKEEKETWPDGRVTWVLTTKMPFRDRWGNTIGTFGMSRDITQLRQTQAALLESQEMLRQRYQAMENDLAHARIIQMALLPQAPPEYKQLQIRFRYDPLDAIGGDFFSFRRLPDGGLAVFLGDLTGHGVSAALFMSLIRCMTERVFETDGGDPAGYVQALDRALMGQIPHGFITAVYCVLKPQDDGSVELAWCGAGHPDPIVWRRATGATEQIAGGDGAIGIFAEFPRETRRLALQKGDRLYLYTDGIPETATPEGHMLGFDNVGLCIADATSRDLDHTLDALLSRVRDFRGGAPAEDDVALIGIEVT